MCYSIYFDNAYKSSFMPLRNQCLPLYHPRQQLISFLYQKFCLFQNETCSLLRLAFCNLIQCFWAIPCCYIYQCFLVTTDGIPLHGCKNSIVTDAFSISSWEWAGFNICQITIVGDWVTLVRSWLGLGLDIAMFPGNRSLKSLWKRATFTLCLRWYLGRWSVFLSTNSPRSAC